MIIGSKGYLYGIIIVRMLQGPSHQMKVGLDFKSFFLTSWPLSPQLLLHEASRCFQILARWIVPLAPRSGSPPSPWVGSTKLFALNLVMTWAFVVGSCSSSLSRLSASIEICHWIPRRTVVADMEMYVCHMPSWLRVRGNLKCTFHNNWHILVKVAIHYVRHYRWRSRLNLYLHRVVHDAVNNK